jgi:heme-degrading monooxygenase HmoA
VPRISLIEAPGDEAAFEAAWRRGRAPLGARLLRSHSAVASFRYVELAPDDAPRPDLPGRVHSAVYEVVVDDLPDGAPFEFVLVNPFEVEAADDDGFVADWTSVRDTVKGRPGYIGSHLHRAVDRGAEFRFLNVSPWAGVAEFTAAVADPVFAAAARLIYHAAHPSLYVAID